MQRLADEKDNLMRCNPKLNLRRCNKLVTLTLAIVLSFGANGTAMAFEVWMGTHRMSIQLSTQPTTWARTSAWVDGINYNRALHGTLVAGWDNFDSASSLSVTSVGAGVTATATVTGTGWSNNDGLGRGSSKDTTWGTFEGPAAVDAGSTAVGVNLTLTNGAAADLELNSFHMDAVAIRPNAARTYAWNVLSGDMTIGNVFTSADDAITHLGGNLLTDDLDPLTHDQHDDIKIGMSGLTEHTLAVGESAVIQIAFRGGIGNGGGHHLFVDNVAFSGTVEATTVLLADVNLDGVVDFLDISPFTAILSGS
jgi:hypothetical protein